MQNSTLENLGGGNIAIITRSITKSIDVEANSWTTHIFNGYDIPKGYTYLFSVPNINIAGVVCVVTNHSSTGAYVRVHALSAVKANLTVTQVYFKQ